MATSAMPLAGRLLSFWNDLSLISVMDSKMPVIARE